MKPKFKIGDEVVSISKNIYGCIGVGKICRMQDYLARKFGEYSYLVVFAQPNNSQVWLAEDKLQHPYYVDFLDKIKDRMK